VRNILRIKIKNKKNVQIYTLRTQPLYIIIDIRGGQCPLPFSERVFYTRIVVIWLYYNSAVADKVSGIILE